MGSTGWRVAKYTVIVGATVALVGCFAGGPSTINITHTAVSGTAWGAGVAAGAAKEIGPAFQSGFHASDGQGAPSGSAWTLAAPPAASLTTTAKPKKVPNCTKAQKKAAAAACA